jgi:hypothetical protein
LIHSPAVRSFGQTYSLRVAIGLLFLIPVALFLAVGLSAEPLEMGPVAIGVGLLVFYGVVWNLMGKTTLSIHAEGVRRTSILGSKELVWGEIAEYRYREIPVQAGGVVGGLVGAAVQAAVEAKTGKKARSLLLTLEGSNRVKLKVDSNFQHAQQAIDRILIKVHDQIRPPLQSRLDNNGEAAFGPLSLSRRGVSWKGKDTIPWTEIKSCEISGGKLRVRRQGKMLDAIGVASQKIPNVILALQMMQTMRTLSDPSGVTATFA